MEDDLHIKIAQPLFIPTCRELILFLIIYYVGGFVVVITLYVPKFDFTDRKTPKKDLFPSKKSRDRTDRL